MKHKKILEEVEAKPKSNIFTFVNPPKAGNGSYAQEFQRFKLFMSTQGAICQNIRHFGGKYGENRNPADHDPDGAWNICLDPEVSLDSKSCIVYSVGYVAMYNLVFHQATRRSLSIIR